MSKAVATSSSGIGAFGLLTIVLVILKALGYISWSWWLVFMPMIISTAIALGFILLILGIVIIAVIADN